MLQIFPTESPCLWSDGKDLGDRRSDPPSFTNEGREDEILSSFHGDYHVSKGNEKLLYAVRQQAHATLFKLPFSCTGKIKFPEYLEFNARI